MAVDGSYGTQTLGLVCLGVDEQSDGTRLVRLALYHDQAGVPEYYTTDAYVSIAASRLPIAPAAGDLVSIDIVTYDGTLTRTFTFLTMYRQPRMYVGAAFFVSFR